MTTTPLDSARWFKATKTNGANACVEVALTPGAVGVRDSKNTVGGQLMLHPARWSTFLRAVKAGGCDPL